jgi:hypothetical protein
MRWIFSASGVRKKFKTERPLPNLELTSEIAKAISIYD